MVRNRRQGVTGLIVCAAVLAAASVYGVIHRGREGRIRRRAKDAGTRVTEADVGVPLGEHATLLQFSTAFCGPCRVTRRVLADVAGAVEGVRHVEIDAEAHLELARRLHVVRTPTLLVLDGHGSVVRRASGTPLRADVIAALGAAG
jgi:thiol-disulfide isomerase/thioredoxin